MRVTHQSKKEGVSKDSFACINMQLYIFKALRATNIYQVKLLNFYFHI